ncbi:MAG: DUF3046 domain-containing protein [Microbacteriaceae bacterium]|nr:DUF3046 domain-containing protein [Microbacteriaceae bacterium]
MRIWWSAEALVVRLSEFRRAVTAEFGESFGAALLRDLVLDDLGNLTSEEALKVGLPARDVWLALCRANDVPEARWHGAGMREPR